MVVKIRFGRGPLVTRRKGKNGRIAMLAASMLTMVAICFASLGMWRLSEDVNLAGGFVYKEGIHTNSQVWIFAAVATQYGAWRLTRYAHQARPVPVGPEVAPGVAGTDSVPTSSIGAKI
jgi:hypothetical protein